MAHVATITIDATKVPADLTDYVVYVNLADLGAGFWNVVANGGGDIRIFKDDGTTEVPREVVSCDTGTDTGELYLKFNGTLSGSVDTPIQIHADGTSSDYAVTDTYGRNNVWTGFVSVWHLEATSGNAIDSKAGTNTLTNNNSVANTTGKLGNGKDFNGTNQSYKNTGRVVDPSSFTVSLWVKRDSEIASGLDTYISNGDTSTDRGFDMGYNYNGGTRQLYYRMLFKGVAFYSTTHNVALGTTNWHHVAMKHTSSLITGYYNGSNVTTLATSGSPTGLANSGFVLGAYHDTDTNGFLDYWDGQADEVRVVSGGLSDDWITTDYNNQNSPSTFYTASDASTSATISWLGV